MDHSNINHVENIDGVVILQFCHGTTADSIWEMKWHDSFCLPLRRGSLSCFWCINRPCRRVRHIKPKPLLSSTASQVKTSDTTTIQTMSFHLRSVSFPSKRCSNEAEVQDELQSLEASFSCPSATIEVMCDGLRRLGDVYRHIEEMIHFPAAKFAPSSKGRSWMGSWRTHSS